METKQRTDLKRKLKLFKREHDFFFIKFDLDYSIAYDMNPYYVILNHRQHTPIPNGKYDIGTMDEKKAYQLNNLIVSLN